MLLIQGTPLFLLCFLEVTKRIAVNHVSLFIAPTLHINVILLVSLFKQPISSLKKLLKF